MSDPRPKLTRRRGACEECRQKKVRCNGANPCNHCQQNGSPCKYNLRRSRRCLQEKNTQTVGEHVFTTTQPYAVNGGTMPGPSNLSSYSEAVIGQTTQQPANHVDIPFDKSHFSQFVPDNVHPYPSLDLSDEMIQETGQPKNIGISPMLNWLDWGYDQNLHQHSTAQSCDLLEAEAGNGTAEYTLALLYGRIVVDKAEGTSGFGSEQSSHEEAHSKYVHYTVYKYLANPFEESFKELEGPSLFIKEQDVMQIQEHFVHPEKPPIDVSDMSLLMVSLAWGALLDPEVSSVSQVALLDAVLEISTMLLHQNRSVRQFLALVAAVQKTGSENLPALILGSVSTVASLNLHLEPILRRNCVSEEQVIQAKRALWVLYCIDKSRALRWQTFSLVDKGSLPTMSLRDDTLQSDIPTVPSLQWLEVRCQYSRICSDILQLRVNADKERSKDGASHRRLLQDLMSPVFLRDVAAPNIYMQACRLVRLWEIKAKCAAGRPFDASGDIFKAALDAVFGFAFGPSWQHSAMQPLIDAITHISVDHGAPDSPASFPEGTQDEVVTATLSLVAAVEKVQGSLSMKLTWLLLSLTPTLRRARRVRERYITDAIREAIAHVIRTSETHTQPLVTSAVEHMVVREQRLADEAGRRPDFFSSAMRGELFGFIVGGHDTTSTTVAWGVKYLADHIPVQERFRTALYAAGSQAKTEGRCPSADEILALRVPYLDAVIEEILRCGGTTPALDREAMVDTQILGRHIPKGTTVLLLTQGPSIRSPPFRVDERLRSETYSSRANSTVHGRSWADHNAEVFDPDRWLVRSQDKNGQDEESFDGTSGPTLAFGLGPRGCWGRRLAYVELRLYLVLIVWNFHLSPCPPELSSYSSIAGITSKPRQCYVRLTRVDL
ncbi:hypothetical protein BM1_10882 [Bipolaris maydis]|nr:hypothetical protein BM1_10882 [Bipolaris maydis]